MPYPNNYSGKCSTNCGREAVVWTGIERYGDVWHSRYPHCEACAEKWTNDPYLKTRTKPLRGR